MEQQPTKRGRRGREESSDSAQLTLTKQASEWKEKVIQIRRVTKVVKGGKKLSFRAIVAVGNGNGKVGIGVGKSNEVIGAIQKAVADARKNAINVIIFNKTIPHPIVGIAGAGKITIKPAAEGTGVIAGGAARSVIELAGIENILCKSLGSSSPLNVARATINALSSLRSFREVAESRGLTLTQMLN